MSYKILLFVGPDCPKCRKVKQAISKFAFANPKANVILDKELKIYESDTVDGLAEGAFHDVRSLPALIIKDSAGKLSVRVDGKVMELLEALIDWVNKHEDGNPS